MGPAVVRSGVLFFAVALLQACGGDDDDSGLPRPPDPVASLSATEISFTAEPGDAETVAEIRVRVRNPPLNGFHVRTGSTTSGIYGADYDPASKTVNVAFLPPHELQDGTYIDTVDVRVCRDFDCREQIDGSPFEVRTTYAISGGRSAVLSQVPVEAATTTLSSDFPEATFRLTFDRPAAYTYQYDYELSGRGLYNVVTGQPVDNVANYVVAFQPGNGNALGPGTHDGTVTLRVCYDNPCLREVGGSPFTIPTRLAVHASPEPGLDPLQVQSRVELPHNVVDAEFNGALDAIVMVADQPVNALYVYDLASGTESQAVLPKKPKAVSLSPDGSTAVVGHDAIVSVVDLLQVGQPGAPDPARLRVPVKMFDLVMDGHGKVHIVPAVPDVYQGLRSVDVATGDISLSSGRQLYGGSRIKLHPTGDFVFTNEGPGTLVKWDITSGTAVNIYESPDTTHETCFNFWIKSSGDTIYTACGAAFSSSTDPAEDLLYSGSLELFELDLNRWQIRALSESDTFGEIALVEARFESCETEPDTSPCDTHLALHDSASLDRQAIYAMPPVAVDGIDYWQAATFVFHDAAGRKILLSKLDGTPGDDRVYFLSVVP